MEILYITSYPLEYNTSANVRNISLIKGLINNGNNVTTLSPYPTNLAFFSGLLLTIPFSNRYWLGSTSVSDVSKKGVSRPGRIRKIVYNLYNLFSVYDRGRRYLKYVNAKVFNKNFDVIISSSDPKSAHLFAERLIKTKPEICKRWIQYWGDPFIGDITSNTTLKLFFTKKEERRIISKADKAVYVSPFTAEDIVSLYPEIKSVIDFLPVPYKVIDKTVTASNSETMLSYLGNYTLSTRDIRPFVQAVSELKLQTNIIGDSDLKLQGSESLLIKDRVPSEELKEIIEKTTIFVCVCNTHGSQIPGKIYHYVDTGKPILIILDGERSTDMKKYFESFNRFYMCNNNMEDIKATISKILCENKSFGVPEALKPETIADKFLK